jgi:transposase-like protein
VCNIPYHRPSGQDDNVVAFIRTVFAQSNGDTARRQLNDIAIRPKCSLIRVVAVIADADDEVAGYATLPRHLQCKIWSTNSIERVTWEIKRRTKAVNAFPSDHVVLQCVDENLAE